MGEQDVFTGNGMCIDSHQHFWEYNPHTHAWITDEMAYIRKSFLPNDLEPVLAQNSIQGCIAVQADQTEKETQFLVEQAEKKPFIKGVVGWVDLRNEAIEERLQYFKHFPIIRGFRHILQAEAPDFMLQKDFIRGICALQKSGYTYDILIYPKHLSAAIELVHQFPDQAFVIDHLAKPYIKQGLIDEWRKDITQIAQFHNVFCKISGMVTEANFTEWKESDFTPYLDTVVNAFGMHRIMFGSDWPVCLVAATYPQVIGIVKKYFSNFSKNEQALFFGENCRKFYGLL